MLIDRRTSLSQPLDHLPHSWQPYAPLGTDAGEGACVVHTLHPFSCSCSYPAFFKKYMSLVKGVFYES